MIRRLPLGLAVLAIASTSSAATCPLIAQGPFTYHFNSACQMVQLANGHFIVADTGENRIKELAEDGVTELRVIGQFVDGTDTLLDHPDGVAVDPVGHIYVADRTNNRILKFDSSIALIGSWEVFVPPGNLALSPDGTVLYVLAFIGDRVDRYTTDGALLGSWGTTGSGPGQFLNPLGIATDAAGKVYVSDQFNDRIQVFSSTGTYLSQFGSYGSNAGQLYYPAGIVCDDSGNLYVADTFNNRIQVFNPSGLPMCSFSDTGGSGYPMLAPLWAYPARDGSVLVHHSSYGLQRFVSSPNIGRLNLSWNDCGAFGTTDRTFACNSNSGSNVIVASFDPGSSVADFAGNEMRIDVTPALSSWWQMYNAGSCRGTAVPTINTTFEASCADNFAGAGFGAIGSYNLINSTASLLCGWAIPQGVPITAGTEYYALNIVINNAKTVGTNACSGCSDGACIVLRSLTLAYGPSATLTATIHDPISRNWITWQGGAGGAGGCPGAVPTQKKTWGQLKALYR
jgi:DNA-binding beta-propeller fold protein YncE